MTARQQPAPQVIARPVARGELPNKPDVHRHAAPSRGIVHLDRRMASQMESADEFHVGGRWEIDARVIDHIHAIPFGQVRQRCLSEEGSSMADDELDMLGQQMWAISQSPKSDPVLKALTHLVWQLIDEDSKKPGDIAVQDMLMRMLREVHNAIAQRRRNGQFV